MSNLNFSDTASLAIAELEDETPGDIPVPPETFADFVNDRYRVIFDRYGTEIEFRRYTSPTLDSFDSVTVKGFVRGIKPEQLQAGIDEKSQNGIVIANDIVAAGGFASSLKKGDRVRWRNQWHTITHAPEVPTILEDDIRINFIFSG